MTLPHIDPSVLNSSARGIVEAQGLVACTPPIRSSDYGVCSQAPFYYYLCRRLGLVKALRYLTALNRGSWFHEQFRHSHLASEDRMIRYYRTLDARTAELRSVCQQLLISPDGRREILDREIKDAETAIAWYEAASKVVISPEWGTFTDFLSRPYWTILGREMRLVTHMGRGIAGRLHLVAQPDMLLYHSEQNTVWIVDVKTTSESPKLRAMSCPIEFQTWHYASIVKSLLDRGMLQRTYDLPSDAMLGGFIHLIVRKPGIEFGLKDRHYKLDTSELKAGPRKGQPRNEKVYYGEPDLKNYTQRVTNWYLGQDDYTHLAPQWIADPPVNCSIISMHTLTRDEIERYQSSLRVIKQYACIRPEPNLFPLPASLVAFSRLSDCAPFVLNPPNTWGDIIQSEGWTMTRRDDIPPETDYDIIREPGSEIINVAEPIESA